MSFERVFLFLGLAAILAEPNHSSNFGKGAWEEHFCEIILKSAIGLGGDVL